MPDKRQESQRGLTSLQRVLCHWQAENTQTRARVRRHLDLILCPDDELRDQAVVDLGAADVLVLMLPGETRQAIPAVEESMAKRLVTMISFQVTAPSAAIPQPVIRGTISFLRLALFFSSPSVFFQARNSTTQRHTKDRGLLFCSLLSGNHI